MINNNSSIRSSRYPFAILYPENMVEDWEEIIADTLQVPVAYCLHDKDLDNDGDERKVHVHMLAAFSNTTTLVHARNVFNLLSLPGKVCCSTVQAAISVRRAYNYLIHDTDDCRKKGKYQYPASDRVLVNNFDIGSFEQISVADRVRIVRDFCDFIIDEGFTNYRDFYIAIRSKFFDVDEKTTQIFESYHGLFDRLIKGNYNSFVFTSGADRHGGQAPSQAVGAPQALSGAPICPHCSCRHVVKKGFSKSGSRRFVCKSCMKWFTL